MNRRARGTILSREDYWTSTVRVLERIDSRLETLALALEDLLAEAWRFTNRPPWIVRLLLHARAWRKTRHDSRI